MFLYSVIDWNILLLATWNSLDTLGVVLACALLGVIVWVFVDWGPLATDSASAIVSIVLLYLASAQVVGASHGRPSGAASWVGRAVDEIDD